MLALASDMASDFGNRAEAGGWRQSAADCQSSRLPRHQGGIG
jgi:hypothetical protein